MAFNLVLPVPTADEPTVGVVDISPTISFGAVPIIGMGTLQTASLHDDVALPS